MSSALLWSSPKHHLPCAKHLVPEDPVLFHLLYLLHPRHHWLYQLPDDPALVRFIMSSHSLVMSNLTGFVFAASQASLALSATWWPRSFALCVKHLALLDREQAHLFYLLLIHIHPQPYRRFVHSLFFAFPKENPENFLIICFIV